MSLLRRLWNGVDAAISASELLLLNTIVVIGAIVGLTTVRDQVVQQFGDLADALQSIDQSFTVETASATFGFVDAGPFPAPVEGQAPACLALCAAGVEEQ